MSRAWSRYLPLCIQQRLEGNPDLHRIIASSGWLFGDKLVRMTIGLFVGVWVARYLGPTQYGQLNYAIAFVSLFTPLSTLGLNGIVVRDLVRDPDAHNAILGSAFALQIIGATCAFFCSLTAIYISRPQDATLKLLVSTLSITLVLKSTEVVKYWFESKVQSKYFVVIEHGAFVALSVIQVILIVTHAPLQIFVWAIITESLAVAAGLIWIYGKSGGKIQAWNVQWQRAQNLLSNSWPLILSGLAIMFYIRIDQIMLGQMRGDAEVGIYSAATRISEVWHFIPTILIPTVFPALIKAKQEKEETYTKLFQKLYDCMVLLALIVAVPMTFLSGKIVHFLFGNEFTSAGVVLSIHIWIAVFAFIGGASARWFLIEGLQRFSFYRAIGGSITNVCINLYTIPKYGAVGAAVGTLLSQIFATYLFDIFHPATRNMFFMKTKSLLILFRLSNYFKNRSASI